MARLTFVTDHDETPDRRRRGRPRVRADAATTSVSARLPVETYDKLFQIAKARRTTVAGTIRDLIRGRLT